MLTANTLFVQAPRGPKSQQHLDLADHLLFAVRQANESLASWPRILGQLLYSRVDQVDKLMEGLVGQDNIFRLQDRHNLAFLDAIALIGGGIDALTLAATGNPAVLVARYKASCAQSNISSIAISSAHARIFELLRQRSDGELLLAPDMHPDSAYFINCILPRLMAAAACGGAPGLLRACDFLILCSGKKSPLEHTATEAETSIDNALSPRRTGVGRAVGSTGDLFRARQSLADADRVDQLVESRRRASPSPFDDDNSISSMSRPSSPRPPQPPSPLSESRHFLSPLSKALSPAPTAPGLSVPQPSIKSPSKRPALLQRDDLVSELEHIALPGPSTASIALVNDFTWARNGVKIQSGLELFTALLSSRTPDDDARLYSAQVEGLNIEKAPLSFFAASTAKKSEGIGATTGASWAISVNGWDLECNDGQLPHLFAQVSQPVDQDRLTVRLQQFDVSLPATTLRQMIVANSQAPKGQFEGAINGKVVEADLSTLVRLIGPGSVAELDRDTQVDLRILGHTVRAPATWMRRLLDTKGQK